MSFDAIGHEGGLAEALVEAINDIGKKFKVTLHKKLPGTIFNELIEAVVEKTGKQVIILIDEYDRPIVDYIDPYDLTMANKQRDILKQFFSILKNASNNIRFLLITGVSKFSKVSIFSELNHLDDLTLAPGCATLCGYKRS
jgi:hypothetical protein